MKGVSIAEIRVMSRGSDDVVLVPPKCVRQCLGAYFFTGLSAASIVFVSQGMRRALVVSGWFYDVSYTKSWIGLVTEDLIPSP